jgi:hypothetical protein
VLSYAAEQGGSVEACVAKPSLVTSSNTLLRSIVGAAARVTGIMPTIGIEELAAAMLQQIRDGFEKEPLMNDDLKRIGQEALAKERTKSPEK